MPERTLSCPECGIRFTSRRQDGSRTHCYRCAPPSAAEVAARGTPCERCGRPSRNARCSRCRLIVACRNCGGDAQLMGARYGDPDASATCRKCRSSSKPKRLAFICEHCGLRTDRRRNGGGDRARFCSKVCAQAHAKATAKPNRITADCEICGTEFSRKPSDFTRRDGNRGGRFCSKKCQGVWISREAAARPKPPKPPRAPRSRIYVKSCDVCGSLFTARGSNGKRCSAQCKIDHAGVRVKDLYRMATQFVDGRYVGAQWRKALIEYLVERDGDKCGICKRRVDVTLKSGTRGSRKGPSVDHIIPRSLGGSDGPENWRLTHWGCNQQRGNRGGGEQLALVG